MYAFMAMRRPVVLSDGRRGVIMRVDTSYPEQETTVLLWMTPEAGPELVKVRADSVVGPVAATPPEAA